MDERNDDTLMSVWRRRWSVGGPGVPDPFSPALFRREQGKSDG